MAGGAADDKGIIQPHDMQPHDPADAPLVAIDPEAGGPPQTIDPAKPQTEWTVSDRRGPLVAAPPVAGNIEHDAAGPPAADVERIVPGSEMDAEGAYDPVAEPMSGLAPGREAEGAHRVEGVVDTAMPSVADHPAASESRASESHASELHASDLNAPPAMSGESMLGQTTTGPEGARADSAASDLPVRRSLWPVAAGIVFGAILGAASAALVYSQSAAPDTGKLADLSARVDALDKRPDPQSAIAGMKGQLADLSSKVASLETRGPAAAPAAAAQRPSADPQVASLGAKVAALQAAVTSAQTLAATARSNSDALKVQQQTLDGKVGALQAGLGGAQKQAATAQAGVEDLRGDQKALAAKLGAPALAVVADSLVEQIVGGKPFATQVDALASLGADPAKVAVLRQNAATGVPSAQVLLAKFQPLVDPVIATGSKAPANAGFGERLKHGLFGLVSVRRADETTGTDLPSRVARIKADLAHNDVLGAYATWGELPPDAKAKSQAWGALAKTSVEAINAARGLQTDSIGSLTAKRS